MKTFSFRDVSIFSLLFLLLGGFVGFFLGSFVEAPKSFKVGQKSAVRQISIELKRNVFKGVVYRIPESEIKLIPHRNKAAATIVTIPREDAPASRQ